MFTAMVAVFA